MIENSKLFNFMRNDTKDDDQYSKDAMDMLSNIKKRLEDIKKENKDSNSVITSKVRKTPKIVIEKRAVLHARRFIAEKNLPISIESDLVSRLIPIIETIENI